VVFSATPPAFEVIDLLLGQDNRNDSSQRFNELLDDYVHVLPRILVELQD
jgi:hypothetical protein